MAIKDYEDNKISPKDAAKRILAKQLAFELWPTSPGFYVGDLTQREIDLIETQIDKLLARINRILK